MTRYLIEPTPPGESNTVESASDSLRMTRRTLLKASIGVAVLVAAPEITSFVLPRNAVAGTSGLATAASAAHYFLYGFADPDSATGAVAAEGQTTTLGSAPVPIATQLATEPVKSPDRTRLALITLTELDTVAAVKVAVVETASASIVAGGTLTIPGLEDALVLVTPVFAADSRTVALVLSVSTAMNPRSVPKLNPLTGGTEIVQTATWVSRHLLAYFDCSTGSFSGPFDLADAPSLAKVNVAANATDLFLWSMLEPAAVLGPKGSGRQVPTPQLSVFPFGSGTARLTVPASPAWPVNEEPMVTLASGRIARLVNGREVELYSPDTGQHSTVIVGPLAQDPPTKPARVSMELRPDGLVFFSNPALGRAVIADPAQSFAAVSTVSFPAGVPGPPSSKAVLSADAKTLYAAGTAAGGGVSAYDVRSGSLQAVSTSRDYAAVYLLPSRALLAIAGDSPRLSFFDASLKELGTADTALHIMEVY